MQFISHTDGLIIDLRNNFGGNGEMLDEILKLLFPTKTYTGKLITESKINGQILILKIKRK
jgi:C-terminal processing protease CtpA/Prc